MQRAQSQAPSVSLTLHSTKVHRLSFVAYHVLCPHPQTPFTPMVPPPSPPLFLALSSHPSPPSPLPHPLPSLPSPPPTPLPPHPPPTLLSHSGIEWTQGWGEESRLPSLWRHSGVRLLGYNCQTVGHPSERMHHHLLCQCGGGVCLCRACLSGSAVSACRTTLMWSTAYSSVLTGGGLCLPVGTPLSRYAADWHAEPSPLAISAPPLLSPPILSRPLPSPPCPAVGLSCREDDG